VYRCHPSLKLLACLVFQFGNPTTMRRR